MTYWESLYNTEKQKDYMKQLTSFVNHAYRTTTVYPPKAEIFTALKATPFEDVRVVIIGQDPYHGAHQAHGLSFSIASPKAKTAPSLNNIFKELKDDLGVSRNNPNLTDWAKQGVLLLNTVLTVESGKAASHRGKGWEDFTQTIITHLNNKPEPVLFVLWGADARSKKAFITNPNHRVIESVHPSPLSAYRGFFGSKPFSKINQFLADNNYPEIKWG